MSATPSLAPKLELSVDEVTAVAFAAVPTLCFRLHLDAGGQEVRSLGLNVQVRIDATRRRYGDSDESRLRELFGGRERWGQTLRNLMWANVSMTVPRFTGETYVAVHVPATYDFEVVAAKYLNALEGGDVPVELLFSGTLFYSASDGRLQASPLDWEQEAATSLPVGVWREAIDIAFPGSAWLRLPRESFDRLWAYRAAQTLPSWEATLDRLLEGRE
ncbi:MAG TPA: DUF6084 family protein [Gaiellaceae bacterium]|nr:DUF6084 family protein [Gaiellaceae bacterium]